METVLHENQYEGGRVNPVYVLVAINEDGDEGIFSTELGGAGHFPFVTQTTRVRDMLTKFLYDKDVGKIATESKQRLVWRTFGDNGVHDTELVF